MAKNVIMPKAGNTVESCVMSTINVKEGDQVNIGDVLFSYETDKTSVEETSQFAGTVLKILVEEDDEVPVFANVMIIGEPGEDISEFLTEEATSSSTEEVVETETKAAPVVQTVNSNDFDGMNVSPRAKNLIEELDLKPENITTASGANGRVMESDVIKAADNKASKSLDHVETTTAAPESTKDESFKYEYTPVRKAIAKGMQGSLQNSAQLTMHTTFDATSLMQMREAIKNNGEALGLENININDMITYVVSRVVTKYPLLNSQVHSDHVIAYNVAHIATAVETEKGLMVPVLKNADSLSLNEISKSLKQLFVKTKQGTITGKEMSGGTFTISNLGNLGIHGFTPVINSPQAAILGVGGLETKIKVVNGEVKPYQAMHLSLTFDHMPVDGMYAANLLKDLVKNLENFNLTLLK